MHDISGDISASISNHYINISAAVAGTAARCHQSGISRADSRAAVSRLSLLYVVVLLRLSCDFMDIYSFSMSHKVYYVNYRRFLAFFWLVSASSRAPTAYGSPRKYLPHHQVVPAWDSLGSPHHRAHQKKFTTYPHPHFERVVYPKNIHHIL